MNNDNNSAQWLQTMRSALAAPELPERFVSDLDRRLQAQFRKRPGGAGLSRRFVLAAAGTAIVLALSAFAVAGPERVIAAVRNALGFLPGFGIVSSESPIRFLAEPVRVERDGIVLTLTRVVADSAETRIEFAFEGLPELEDGTSGEGETCPGISTIVLPDGGRIPSIGGGGGPLDAHLAWHESFPPLPTQAMNATLIVPCIPLTPKGVLPENWEIPFRLSLTEAPAVFQTVKPSASTSPAPSTQATAPAATFPGITIGINRFSELEDGYILIGVLEWDPQRYIIADAGGSTFTLTDGEGRILDSENAGFVPEEPDRPNTSYWSVRVRGKDCSGPITVRPDSVYVFLRDPLLFTLGVGANPSVGQEWEIGKTFDVFGRSLAVLSARYISEGGMPGLSVAVRAPAEITRLVVGSQNPPEAGGGPEESSEPGVFRWRVFFQNPPNGGAELFIQQITVRGEWTTVWNPQDT
jgi:hypothetical protein